MTLSKEQPFLMKMYEGLDTLVPFQILKLALMWAIFTGIQELLQKGFDCPCIHTYNRKYGLMFLFLPMVTFIMLSLLLLKGKICCSPSCKRFWQLVPRVLFPVLMWMTVVLLDGDAVACIETNSESQNLSDILCKFKTNKPLSTDQEQFLRYQLYKSQNAGLWLLLVMSGLALLIQLCKWCKLCETCIRREDNLEKDDKVKDYKEKAQQKIEDLAVSILLKEQEEEVERMIEQALNDSRKRNWTEIYNLCKDINLPTGVTDSENSSASQQGTPGAGIPDPASAGGSGPVHREEEQGNTASGSRETDRLVGGGKRLQRGDQSQRSRQHYGRL